MIKKESDQRQGSNLSTFSHESDVIFKFFHPEHSVWSMSNCMWAIRGIFTKCHFVVFEFENISTIVQFY